MKRITLLLAFIGMISLQSCTVNDDVDHVDYDTIAQVFEVNRSFTAANDYSSLISYPPSINPIYPSDMVLAYRLDKVVNGTDVWKLMPQTFYFADGTLDFRYDFDFTQYDIDIYMEGFDLATVSSTFRNNQIFRIVIVPADFANKTAVDYQDYDAVVKALKINESKILKIN
ncbi:MAG: hypothetical protein V4648_06845 [Bacteroidota bacterium]